MQEEDVDSGGTGGGESLITDAWTKLGFSTKAGSVF